MDADTHKFEELKHQVIRTGGYYVHFYFDMHANNEQSLKESMVGFVSRLTNEEGVRFAVGEIDEATERDGMFSSTAKVSMLIHDLPALTRLTMAYGPVGVDLQEPNESRISIGELQIALMGISAMAQDLTQYIIQKEAAGPGREGQIRKADGIPHPAGAEAAGGRQEGGRREKSGRSNWGEKEIEKKWALESPGRLGPAQFICFDF